MVRAIPFAYIYHNKLTIVQTTYETLDFLSKTHEL